MPRAAAPALLQALAAAARAGTLATFDSAAYPKPVVRDVERRWIAARGTGPGRLSASEAVVALAASEAGGVE